MRMNRRAFLGKLSRVTAASLTAGVVVGPAFAVTCERGRCEHFIKDFKNALQADRLSCHTFAANFFRLLGHTVASMLLFFFALPQS